MFLVVFVSVFPTFAPRPFQYLCAVSETQIMPEIVRIRLSPKLAADEEAVRSAAIEVSPYRADAVGAVVIRKRSIDARRGVVIQMELEVFTKDEAYLEEDYNRPLKDVSGGEKVAVIGMGPAGLFAALKLAEEGYCPVLFERGKDVRQRRRDLAKITRDHVVHEDSNYCFGEGGAGTYSDGKLYTRSHKRGSIKEVLERFVAHGASPDILVDAHPHIGTNKLPGIIASMRETLLAAGAVIHFETRVTGIEVKEGRVAAIETSRGKTEVNRAILATGHSARDVFEWFYSNGYSIEAKPFALGVRVEHPQALIDQIQYHCDVRDPYLPPASYSLVHQAGGRGVYSFCMCPGGIIAPCATAPGEVVTNGWSPSRRNNPFANSGMVVSVEEDDLKRMGFEGPLAAMRFQQSIEQLCCDAAGGRQSAPAQRLVDFLANRSSETLPECSYKPGIVSVNLRQLLPDFIAESLAEGLTAFGKKMKGFLHPDAVLVAPESRTSSPVRIPRDRESFEHPEISGLYPCGEGAGYAGGIVSAALDGLRVAKAIGELRKR